jgi:HSP20 family molecular chaperone IbpA
MATKTLNEQAPATNQGEPTRQRKRFRPHVDIVEVGEELRVFADLPGAKPEEIDIHFEKGVLTIRAPVTDRPLAGRPLLHEYGVGDFIRTFEVGEAIDATKITAEYREGVLTLHLPKQNALQPRKIAVSTG